MIYRIILFGLFIVFLSSSLRAQTSLNFEFEYSEDFDQEFYSEVSIRLPNGGIKKLYFDSSNEFHFQENNYFKLSGEYELLITFKHNSPDKESITYIFEVDLNEILIELKVSFRTGKNLVEGNRVGTGEDKIAKGYISLIKYYESLNGIELQSINIESSEYYRGPFFEITNNSNQKIYGENLPGYFWGSLYYGNSDSSWINKIDHVIDLNFTPRQPLSPGSSRIATVGSFGVSNQLQKGLYKYEILYTLDGSRRSYKKLEGSSNFEWWVSDVEFYKISYIYEH